MANNDLIPLDQLHEEELVPAEETKPSAPTNVLGSPPPSAPIFDVTKAFFSGSLPPQFQLDSNFSRARVESGRVPKAALMPFGIQSNPSTNAAIQSSAIKVVQSAAGQDIDTDNDTPIVNLQTGTQYTVQQSDLNKLISINNAAGGTIYLPPVTGTTNVSINNIAGSGAFFNSGNTVVVGQVATSTAAWTVVGSPLNAGDILMLALRLVASPGESVGPILMSDNQNGNWATIIQSVSSASGVDTLVLAYITNQKAVAVGGSLTLTLSVTYGSTVFNPNANTVFNMTGLKAFAASAQATAAAPGAGGYTFGTAGLAITNPSTFIALADEQKGGMVGDTPDAFAGLSWTSIISGATALGTAFLLGAVNATIKEVWHATGSVNDAWGAILAEFVNATASDIQQFTNNFFCYVENKGVGTFNLVSSLPIDGVNAPVPLATNQGVLLFYDATSNGWYSVRGIGGGQNTVTTAVTLTNNAIILGAGSKTIKIGDLTGDATTSGSNAVSVVKVNGASIPVSDLLVGTNGSGQFVLGATAVNAQSGTTYTFADTDRLKVVTITNSAAMAVTLPQAGASSQFVAGWFCYFINRGTGIATITPTTSTINGNATLVLQKNQAVIIVSDGSNYVALGTLLGDQNATLTDGFLLSYDGTNHKWVAISPGSVSGISAVALRGISIASSAATPGDQDVLKFNAANNDWEPVLADGLLHGDPVWRTDAAFVEMRDDFASFQTSTNVSGATPTAQLGSLGWNVFGSMTNQKQSMGGLPPNIGTYSWQNNAAQQMGFLMWPPAFNNSAYHSGAEALLDAIGWKATFVFRVTGCTNSNGSAGNFATQRKAIYVGFMGPTVSALETAAGSNTASSRPDIFIGLRFDTSSANGTNMVVTSVANAAAGSTVYTGTFTNGGTNGYAGINFTIRGAKNSANNGTFACTASTATTLTLSNASGVSESVAANYSISAIPSAIILTAAANASGGTTAYTMTNMGGFSNGANNSLAGVVFVVAGFTNGANNGTFTCTASTNTTITLNNAAGVAETHAATATVSGATGLTSDVFYTFEATFNNQYSTQTRHYAVGQQSITNLAPADDGWHRLDITYTVSGQVTLTLDGSNTNTVTFTIAQMTNTAITAAGSSVLNNIFTLGRTVGTTGANGEIPWAMTGSKVTFSGFTGGSTALNSTFTALFGDPPNNGNAGELSAPGIANIAGGAVTGTPTATFWPGLLPVFGMGNDDSGTVTVQNLQFWVDFYSMTWNSGIATPGTSPIKTKPRYW